MVAGKLARAAIALGANQGNPQKTFPWALERLKTLGRGVILAQSRVYKTRPEGPAQPRFQNAAVIFATPLKPESLLEVLHQIEAEAGRDRSREKRFGPRPLDLDLIFYEDQEIDTEALKVPHPRAHLRRFVLQPLSDIAPLWIHPTLGKSVQQLLQDLGPSEEGEISLQGVM